MPLKQLSKVKGQGQIRPLLFDVHIYHVKLHKMRPAVFTL